MRAQKILIFPSGPKSLFVCLFSLALAGAEESKTTENSQDIPSGETLGDIAEELQRRSQQADAPPKGNPPQVVDPKNQEVQRAATEEKSITDSGMLSFLNFGLKELGQPLISIDELGSVDLEELPKEYFIVLDREGDGHALCEWTSGEFLRIRKSTWESWSPADVLRKENVVTGKMIVSIPDQRFAVFLRENGDLRSALLRIKGRLWTINFSRPDGLSPAFPLVPDELFYEKLRDRGSDKKEK